MSNAAVTTPGLKIRRSERHVEMEMLSHPDVLRPVRIAIEEFAAESGMDAEQAGKVGLVLNEALANVMRHGYDGATDRPIELTLDRRGSSADALVEVKIRDWARPFDPASLPKKLPVTDPDQIKPGGLGLMCMNQWMDEVQFTKLPDGMLLRMIKKVAAKSG